MNKSPDEKSTIPLEFIHTDLAGPVEETGRDGFKYAMNFVDDCTVAIFVYFLKQKSDATKALKKFLSDIAPYGKVRRMTPYGKVRNVAATNRMRSDNGGEYVADEYENVLIDHQIRHEFSAPYSPHQNGTAERCWRTLFDMARAMLIESGLPKSMWPYAVMAAAHIRNRVFSQRIGDTPYHLLTGKKPSISKLHVFGSVCYANIHEKKKLDPRCRRGYFVGYDKYSPAYLVYLPELNTVVKNGTVKFTEKFENDSDNGKQEDHPTAVTANTPDEDEPEMEDSETNQHDVNQIRPRYPKRTTNKPKHLSDYSCSTSDICYKIMSTNVPTSYEEATKSDESQQWKEAMDSEMRSLQENEVFTATILPAGKKAIGSRWVYSIKRDPEGNMLHKARFVAKGYSQVQGSDYSETFAPTPKITIRMMMQVSAEYNLEVHQVDVRTAYLNAPIDCEVYLTQPDGYNDRRKGTKVVWRLHKSLYGLKQSGRNWNFVLSEFFIQSGFTQSKVDVCLFTKGDDDDVEKTIIVIWVDDIIIAASNENNLNETKDSLKKRFNMKDLGPISYFLGIQFKQTETSIEMSQSFYLQHILERFNMADCKPRTTPCELKLEMYEACNGDNHDQNDMSRYREIVGSLVYAMTCTRPDLAWTVTKLSQHLSNPTEADWITAKHVLRYIKGSMEHKLVYKKSQNGLKISGYSDSDWASNKEDRKSTTGYCFSLDKDGPVIVWKSRKQQTVALSSSEAEYMAIAHATQEALFLSMLSKDMSIPSSTPIQIQGGNQGSIDMVKNPISNDKSKHIDIKHHFIREKYMDGFIDVVYVHTGENTADLMTKPSTRVKLDKFKSQLFGQ